MAAPQAPGSDDFDCKIFCSDADPAGASGTGSLSLTKARGHFESSLRSVRSFCEDGIAMADALVDLGYGLRNKV